MSWRPFALGEHWSDQLLEFAALTNNEFWNLLTKAACGSPNLGEWLAGVWVLSF
jgi:hypothetical protein